MSQSAIRLYRCHLGLALIGLGLVIGAGAFVLATLPFAWPSAQAISRSCQDWLQTQSLSALLGTAIALLALTSVGRGLVSAFRQIKGSRGYLAQWPRPRDEIVGGFPCRVIDSAEAQAFCAGYLRPRIYLSEGALRSLNAAELQVVLAHEDFHRARRDPLHRLLSRALADGLFFLPVLARSNERYVALGELAADEAAIRAARGRQPLASALVKFTERTPGPIVGLAPERVDHLLGRTGLGRWQLPKGRAGGSTLALLSLTILVFFFLQGSLSPSVDPALLLALGCMLSMILGPAIVASAAVLLSFRVWRGRRASV